MNFTERSLISSSPNGLPPMHDGFAYWPAYMPPPASHHAASFATKVAAFSHGQTLHGSGTGEKQMNRPLTGSSSTQSFAVANAAGPVRASQTRNRRKPNVLPLVAVIMYLSPPPPAGSVPMALIFFPPPFALLAK